MPAVFSKSVAEIAARDTGTGYVAFHAPRYVLILRVIEGLDIERDATFLDVGPSELTVLIHELADSPIDSLGFVSDTRRETIAGNHYVFDLNHAGDASTWPADLPAYDIIVIAEVIEHLQVSPKPVLDFLHDHLTPSGVVILQTPNAAAFGNRVKLMLGVQPFCALDEDPQNPRHFREYTVKELRRYGRAAGFDVAGVRLGSYFDHRFGWHSGGRRPRWVGRVQNVVYRLLPPRMRSGITLVLRRAD
jgi:SAM-dependent methyltransferase